MKNLLLIIVATGVSLFMTANSADIAAGKAKSGTCAACHGANGVSAIPIYPNLAGQKEAYLTKQLKAFKDGVRKDPTMAPMASALSDDDVANLAAYFSSLPANG